MTKHTAGPWEISDYVSKTESANPRAIILSKKTARYFYTSDDKKHVVGIADIAKSTNFSEDIANAQLIAAAPELLELSRQIIIAIEHQEKNGGKIERALLSELSAAIAKAEGGKRV